MGRNTVGGIAAALVLLGAVSTAVAADLQAYLDQIQTLRAGFVQSNLDPRSDSVRISRGELVLQAPGRFRWDYREPYRQLIVADGERVWHYDYDLEQVTVQPLTTAMGSTPLGLLMGDTPVDDAFRVSDLGEHQGEHWFELRPRAEDSHFNLIRIALAAGQISALELDDALGQTTQLRFEDVAGNVAVDPELFEFTPPPGWT